MECVIGYETNLALVIALTCVFACQNYAALSFRAGSRIAAPSEFKNTKNSIDLNFVTASVCNSVSNGCLIDHLDSSKSLLLDLAGVLTTSAVTTVVRKLHDQYFNIFLYEFSTLQNELKIWVYQTPALWLLGVQI